MCLDKNGVLLAVGDVVVVGGNLLKRPQILNMGLSDVCRFTIDRVTPVVPPSGLHTHLCELSPLNLEASAFIGTALAAKAFKTFSPYSVDLVRAGAASLPHGFTTPAAAAPTAIQTADGHALQSGDIVKLTNRSMSAWGSYNNITSRDEFVCTLMGQNHPSGCELSLDAIDPSLSASLMRNLGGPLYCDAREVDFVRLGALSLAASATPSAWQTKAAPVHKDAFGVAVQAGDTVQLTSTAYAYFSLKPPIMPDTKYKAVSLDQYGMATLNAVDPALDAELVLAFGRPSFFVNTPSLEVCIPTNAPTLVQMATPYQPVLAPPPEAGEKKPFDHASLGTDLSGDELMKSIRDICGR